MSNLPCHFLPGRITLRLRQAFFVLGKGLHHLIVGLEQETKLSPAHLLVQGNLPAGFGLQHGLGQGLNRRGHSLGQPVRQQDRQQQNQGKD